MSTFLLIWDLCKLQPETRWNWPSFSNKLIFWPGLWENSQRFWPQMSQPRDSPGAQSWFVPGTQSWAGRPGQTWQKERMWTDPSEIKILVCYFLMGLFSLPRDCIGSSKPCESQRMYLEGTGRNQWQDIATVLKFPSNRNIERLSAMEMFLKRRTLGLLGFISPAWERVTKWCRTRQVTNWRALFLQYLQQR